MDLVAGSHHADIRVVIRKLVEVARAEDCDQARGVEREEPDPALAPVEVDVGPRVDLVKV